MIAQPAGDAARASRTIDARGYVVMPGGVDVHSHIAGSKVNGDAALRPESAGAAMPCGLVGRDSDREPRAVCLARSSRDISTPVWGTRPRWMRPSHPWEHGRPMPSSGTLPCWTS